MEHLDCQVFFNFLVNDEGGRFHLNACKKGRPGRSSSWITAWRFAAGPAQESRCIVTEDIPNVFDPERGL